MTDDNYWLVDTVIKPSDIHGYGRFAAVYIPKDTIVGVLNGKIVNKDGKHLPIKGTNLCVVCPQTYVNHSTNSNLELSGQIVFVANRDILANEELTLNYTSLTVSALPFV